MNPVVMLDEVDKVGADWRGDPVRGCSRSSTRRRTTRSATTIWTWNRPLARAVHRHGERGRHDPRSAARSDGGHHVRRLHDRREGRDRPRVPVSAPGRAERPREDEVGIATTVIRVVVIDYTREAGVRQLERELGTRCGRLPPRSRRVRAEAPIAIDEEFVRDALGRQKFFQKPRSERPYPASPPGSPSPAPAATCSSSRPRLCRAEGGFVLTGQLGDVMKESARIALSYVRGPAARARCRPDAFEEREFHVHVPAGAPSPRTGPARRYDGDRSGVARIAPSGETHTWA